MTSKEAINKIMKVLNLTNAAFYDAKTDQGVALKMEGDTLEVGKMLYVATDEGMIPAPAGTHMLEDGSQVEVDEEGKVSKIKMGTTNDAELEKKKTEDEIKSETMAESQTTEIEMESGDIKLKDGSVFRIGGDVMESGVLIKKVGYDGATSAIADGDYETEDGKVLSIVGGAIQGVQSIASKDAEGGKFTETENVEMEEENQMTALAEAFATTLKKLETKLDDIARKTDLLETKFKKFSNEPAGSKITKNQINPESFSTNNSKLEGMRRFRDAISQNN